jgi:hypothetical protein
MTEDKRRPIDRIELPPGVNRAELLVDIERLRKLLHARGDELPADVERDLLRSPRDELLADVEGMRSLVRTGQELRSNARRQHIACTIAVAENLAEMIMGDKVAPEARLGIQYLRFRPNVLNLIDELKKDCSPTVAALVGIDRGLSPFQNAIKMIVDRYRHCFDKEPGYSTSPLNDQVGGPFIRFAEAMLAELDIHKEDGTPYAPARIKEAVKKLRRG